MIDPGLLLPFPRSTFPDPMQLSRRQSRLFVVVFVLVALALAVFAAVAITRGWQNETLQERIRQQEEAARPAR